MSAGLRGTFTALVTPFTAGGDPDDDALDRLVDLQLEGGVEGIVPCGTTGEAATLSNDEHIEVVERVARRAAGRAMLIPGVGGNDTRNVIGLARRCQDLGVDAVLAVAPYYNKPTQGGMIRHFVTIAEAVDVPVVLYNVPGRTASNLEPATVLELAGHSNIVAIKEASGSLPQVMQILADRPDGFAVLSGEDNLTFPLLCMGADGVVSVASNQIPGPLSRLVRHALDGDLATARDLHFRYLDLMEANFLETNPIPVKAGLAMMGLIEESYRLPLVPMDPTLRTRLRAIMADLDLVDAAG